MSPTTTTHGTDSPQEYSDAESRGPVPDTYPGGKSGAGVYQRLINLIPRHRVLISAFGGHCGIVRNIRPAEHTIVIDEDPEVCQWWHDWRLSPRGRAIEIHNCDSIEWLRFHFRLTEFAPDPAAHAGGTRADSFVFADPPYVLSERSHGKMYQHELTDDCHRRLLQVLTQLPATAAAMVCGYESPVYRPLDNWRSIDHRVPTRGGLQDERIWMNYPATDDLHDFRHIGDDRRERERIRRRQVNWLSQLNAMGDRERAAMLAVLNSSQAANQ